jgi:pimeloyl-ACP methyl ester carboxylesterase
LVKVHRHLGDSHSDFCILNGRLDARLSDVERLTIVGGGSLDRVLSTLARSISSVTLESLVPGLDLVKMVENHERYVAMRNTGELKRLFEPPDELSSPLVTPIHGFPNGGVYDLAFPSVFPVSALSCTSDYDAVKENQVSYVRLWEHAEPNLARPTIVAIHGWTMGDQRVNSLAFLPGFLFSIGCNVALVELPFHGRRKATGDMAAQVPFPSADPVHTTIGVAHSLRDLRALRSYLASRGHSKICCVGMSLGAYVAALWLSLDRIDRAALLVPLVSMGDMAWELLKARRRAGDPVPKGLTRAVLRDLFWEHCALAHEPKTEQESIMVIGGRGDHLVPSSQVELLRKHWPHANFEWASGGHAAATQRGEAFEVMLRFLLDWGEGYV